MGNSLLAVRGINHKYIVVGGGNMQFQTLKAVKNSDSQFYVAIASIGINSEGKYEGILIIVDKKKPKSKYEASDIHIVGRNKETIYRQIREIAGLYPPIKKDVIILDTEEMGKLYEKWLYAALPAFTDAEISAGQKRQENQIAME